MLSPLLAFDFPVEIKLLLTYLVTEGLVSLGRLFGKDLSGRTAALTAAIVGGFLFFLTSLINSLPPDQQTAAATISTLIVLIIGAFGLNDTVKGFSAPK